jgi:starch synthase
MPGRPRIAIVIWGTTIEDWLAPLGLTFDQFCEDMDTGWLFGYVAALARAGFDSVIFCSSQAISSPVRRIHRPSGAVVSAYPLAARMRVLPSQRRLLGAQPARSAWRRAARALAWHAVPFLDTRAAGLVRTVRRERCAALLSQDYETARFDLVAAAGRLLGVPVFATYQGINVQASRLEALTRPASLRLAAGLVVPAQAELDRVRATYGVPEDRLAKIFNPIDLDVWRPVPREHAREALGLPVAAEVAVTHGRVDIDDKGLDVLLEAWRRVRAAAPDRDRRLLLVGSGPAAPTLRSWLESGRHPGVHWVDEFVLDPERLRALVSAGDLCAFAGRYEGFPVAPIEAMACGLPVVATAASGIPDMFGDPAQAGGTMVPKDDPGALAAAVGRLLDDPAERAAAGRRARAWVERHCSLDVVSDQLAAFLARRAGVRSSASHAGSGPPR